MKRIKRLDATVADQIAAGEVVERPASVVKELCENAIDAGATKITVEVQRGGKDKITISDNGTGIHPDDLALAISSHATSKIAVLADLQSSHSMGFRGEALASICAVSRFTLTSHASQCPQAYQISSEQPVALPASLDQGTRIEISELFVNVPARRKFLRQDKTELSHIEECVKRLAIGQPQIAWQLIHDRKTVLNVPAQHNEDASKRLRKIIGSQLLSACVPLQAVATGLELSGFVSDERFFRSQSDHQYFYLNGRYIRDRLIAHAIKSAYQDFLYPGRQPGYILFLNMDPAEFDVNVHPTKQEVRFDQSRLIHDFIQSSIRKALAQPVAPVRDVTRPASAATSSPPQSRETPTAKIIGRCFDDIVLLELDNQLHVVNLKKTKRQLVMQTLQTQYERGQLRAKPLLIPERCTTSSDLIETLSSWHDSLLQLGIECQTLVGDEVILRQLPSVLDGVNAKALLPPLLQLIQDSKVFDEKFVQACFQLFGKYLMISPAEQTPLLEHYCKLESRMRDQAAKIFAADEL